MNLLNQYKSLDKKIWDYYADNTPEPILNPFQSNINSERQHKQFIEKYFGKSGKREVLQDFQDEDFFSGDRAIHTNSVFFFGLLMREKTIIKDKLFKDKLSKMDYPIFPFLWFLSILFHDYAMKIENESVKYLADLNDVKDLMKKYDIQHNLLERSLLDVSHYLPTLISKYFLYRRFSSKKIDHGIFSGMYLFDRLVKIRLANEFKKGPLSWHVSLEEKYALASLAIACHNIWTTKKGSAYESEYVKFELKDLIIPEFKQISLNNFPLLFLFGIVDTIDPIKIYSRIGHLPEEILSSLEVNFTQNSFTIKNTANSKLDFEILQKASNNFIGWLTVTIDIATKNEMTIGFI
ncbi:hypothetical protein [Flavobacterium cerinum]|uniref:Uncharacterized protein n=1 Tax=Flavobacterium cerinum TaxID=2502784 RepID=A0A3S3QTC1_9FLAO|nr:hypothetical protein [Flavobacterium cerinum]RWX02210.1 hypothetical protein EPI11_03050 [Flavobacterium cerinum]